MPNRRSCTETPERVRGHRAASKTGRRSDLALQSRSHCRERTQTVRVGQHCRHHHVRRCRDWLRPAPHEVTANFPGPRYPFGAPGRGESSRPLRSPRSIPRCVRTFGRQFRHGGTFLIVGSFSLSLGGTSHRSAAARRGAFGSSLKGIPPTVPSPRSAPPPRDERAIPLLTK